MRRDERPEKAGKDTHVDEAGTESEYNAVGIFFVFIILPLFL